MSEEPAPPSFEDPRRFLSRHQLRPKDSFGQCFLVAPPVAEAIVAAVDAHADETVIEIGTGCGTLARMIAPSARRVIAIERDRDLVSALREEELPSNIDLVEDDAATFDYAAVCDAGPTKVVGNLPYQITGRILRALVSAPRWRVAVVMVQREVGLRMTAAPGDDDWGTLGVFVTAACTVRKVADASPRCFHPPPRVHSVVVKLVPRDQPLVRETPLFSAMVHALFSARRKTLRNGLSNVNGLGREGADLVCAAADIDSRRRPETLSLPELGRLADAIASR